ncbi:MAG: PAS domain S-box protein, partial [Planctomycetota bacterium]|nr:PAS domain S-box protein [Planctomycetota bacterium]
MGPKQHQTQPVQPSAGADAGKGPDDERRQLQRALTLSVSRAPGYLDALTDLLRRVCLAQSWAYGEAWLTTRDESILKPGPAWARTPSVCGTFRQRGRKLGFRRGAGLPGRVLETLKPEWIEDVTVVPKARFGRPDLAQDAGLRAALALPVRTPRDVLAVLVFYADAPLPQDTELADRLTSMLGSLGPLLERKRIEEELRVHARQQEAVARLGMQALDQNSDIDQLLQDAVALVVRELDTEFGDMLEVLPRRHALLLRAGVGWEPERVGRMTLPGGMDSHAGYALLINETLRIEDFERETRFNLPMYIGERDLTSGVSVIIHGHRQPVGVLGVYTGRRRRFTDDDVNFLQGVANVLGTALERTRAAEALRESEARIRAIVETAVDGIITIDETGTIETFNPAAERLFGYCGDEILGANVRMLVPTHLREQHNSGLVHHARTGELRNPSALREVEGRRKDGSLFPMHLSVERLRIGDEVLFVGMIHDLTRQKAVERALEKERGFVSAVLDIAGALVAVLDIDGGVMRFNRACQTTTGYSLEEVEGRPLWELLPSLDERDTFRRLFDEMRAGGSPRQCECECRTAAGDRRRIVWNFTALRNATGEADFVVAAGLDVTARRQAEQELERHRQDLERLVE